MRRIPLFDAHCDTVLRVLDWGADFANGSSDTHVDWPRLRGAGVRVQVFACFILASRYPGSVVARAEQMLDAFDTMLASTEGELRLVRSAGDLNEAFSSGPHGAILALEGGDPLGGRAEALRAFAERGVRDVIFAWQDNPFSGTAFGRDTGLTLEGGCLLGLCEELGVMVDVSHLSDRAFEEVCEQSTKPFIASHSNCRALCPSRRNLSDRMIRALADRGGVMGINLSSGFLSPETMAAWQDVKDRFAGQTLDWREKERLAREIAPTVPRPSLDWVLRHVLHAIDVGGEDCVGLGGDLDGIVHLPDGIDGVQDYPQLAEHLRGAGLSERQVEKICSGNLQRAFADVLPG